jgi:hypothetical protein
LFSPSQPPKIIHTGIVSAPGLQGVFSCLSPELFLSLCPSVCSAADQFLVNRIDGSQMTVQLRTEAIAITTRYGKLEVPVSDVLSIDVGLRHSEGIQKRVEAAVAQLGDSDFKVRQAATQELRRLRSRAYPALERALDSTDLEVKSRAARLIRELRSKVPADELRVADHDVLVTPEFSIIGRIEGQTLPAHASKTGAVQIPLAEIVSVRSVTAERMLLQRVGAAVKAGRTTLSPQMGTGKDPYEEVPPEGALLIGFEVTQGRFGANLTIKTVRPIFMTPSGRKLGKTHGVPGEGVIRVEAKPGYAVGAVTIKAGLGVDGMSVTFMEIGPRGLSSSRAYESEWLGGMGGGEKTKLGGTGAPVVGIFGKTADGPQSTFNGLGLVTMAREE